MGIFDRLKRIIRSEFQEDRRSFDEILTESDDELRRLIEELNRPKATQQTSNQGRQQTGQSARQRAQVNAVHKAYQVLGLSPAASIDQIKSAYRALMREYHPDKMSNASAQQQEQAKKKAQEINLAYDVVSKVRGIR